jgi:signal transduction histidine kinase
LAQEISSVHGLPVEFSIDDGLEAISPDVKLCLFRIAQEALSNVVKPSGASHAEVRLVGTRSITLTVADDGKGFTRKSKPTAWRYSIRERPRLVGGELRILSSRPAGTRVEVSVPLGNGIPQQAASAV